MSISPLLIVAIVAGLVIVVVVGILLVGGAAWFALRKKPKTPAKRQASAAAQSRPPVRTPPRSSPGQLPVKPQKPVIVPAPQPAGPAKPPVSQPEAVKRPPQPVIEIVDKEQERVAQEMSGAAKNWKTLFADAFNNGAQENAGAAVEIPAMQDTSPDAQILVDTLNNTAKDVSGGMATAGLAEASGPVEARPLASKAHLPGLEKTVPFLDLFVDLTRQLSGLVQNDLVAGSKPDTYAYAYARVTFAAPAPLLGRSFTDVLSGSQPVPSGIVDERPSVAGARVSPSQAVQYVTQARQTVEKAYFEVLSSLGNGTSMAGQAGGSTLAGGFDKAKEILSGGSQ